MIGKNGQTNFKQKYENGNNKLNNLIFNSLEIIFFKKIF